MPAKKKNIKKKPYKIEEYIILKLDRVEAELCLLKDMVIRNGNQTVILNEKMKTVTAL